jgi:hypothetical protein
MKDELLSWFDEQFDEFDKRVPRNYDLRNHPNSEDVQPLEISPFVEQYKRIIEEVVKHEKTVEAYKESLAK